MSPSVEVVVCGLSVSELCCLGHLVSKLVYFALGIIEVMFLGFSEWRSTFQGQVMASVVSRMVFMSKCALIEGSMRFDCQVLPM